MNDTGGIREEPGRDRAAQGFVDRLALRQWVRPWRKKEEQIEIEKDGPRLRRPATGQGLVEASEAAGKRPGPINAKMWISAGGTSW